MKALVLSAALVLLPMASFADPLAGLRKGHPRLVLTDQDLESLKRDIRGSPAVTACWEHLKARAERTLKEKPVAYEIPDGLRLLGTSKRCLERMYLLGLAWRLTGDDRFAERAFVDLKAAAAFPDWNPKHFLDTGEMSHAFGIGYDWFYGWLGAERREIVRRALVEKGLRPYLDGCAKKAWWSVAHSNWGQVCHGGAGVAALALAEEEPEIAEAVLKEVFAGLPVAMRAYAPDGGIPEGPAYWHYATQYAVFLMAALETATGKDGGLSDSPGFADTGLFRLHSNGPTGLPFNYADANERAGAAEEMFWLARWFSRPEFAGGELAMGGRPSVLALIWGRKYMAEPGPARKAYSLLPVSARFTGVDVVFMRSRWEDPRAVFVGLKGGDNAASHGHLDLGTFVLDALGQRWAADLGADDYNMPGYFGDKRWTYYRLRTESHNTLLIGGRNQDSRAVAPVTAFRPGPGRSHAVVDLTAAYAPHATTARRGMALLEGGRVLVQDEVELPQAQLMEWSMHTRARVVEGGSRVELGLGGERLLVEVVEPAGAVFACEHVAVSPPQSPNEGVSRLVIRLTVAQGRVRLAVLMSPGRSLAGPQEPPPAMAALKDWR